MEAEPFLRVGMISYRQATRDELGLAVEWAASEGWNPGEGDADVFWAMDSAGFVCAERDGEVIATGSVVAYGRAFGFMGFFIVRPDVRGQGIGRDFWYWRRDLLRSRLDTDASIGMDGVFDMQPFYAKGGFTFTHRNLRMTGVGQAASLAAQDGLHTLRDLPMEQVVAFDRRHFGFPREEFLRRWKDPVGGLGIGVVNGGELQGVGVVRPCQNGFKIGPLFAEDSAIAERLWIALSNHAAGQPLYLDVPENNPAAVAMAQRYQLEEVFGCARMYHGPSPDLPWSNIYGVTTFELG